MITETAEADWPTALDDIVGSPISHLFETLNKLNGPAGNNALSGLRSLIRNGVGYWDFLALSPDAIVSIVEATYSEHSWITVPGDHVLKVRILLKGKLRAAGGQVLMNGSGAYLVVQPGQEGAGYRIEGNIPLQMVVLHFTRQFLTDRIGLAPDDLPMPLGHLFDQDGPPLMAPVRLGLDVLRAANDIRQAANHYPHPYRRPYIEARCIEIICAIMQQLSETPPLLPANLKLTMRDINRIHEARDLIAENFASPPSIRDMARHVGLNQTKLKFGFKAVFNMTIYEFVRRCRMERAAEMLRAGEQTIAEIAYEVGFNYPTNFTHAYVRYFGALPREMRRQQ